MYLNGLKYDDSNWSRLHLPGSPSLPPSCTCSPPGCAFSKKSCG